MSRLWTIQEVAKKLNVHTDTVRKLVWSRQVAYINLNPDGKYIVARFTKQQVQELLKKCEVKAG